jgi:ACS family hexuronate transporter-like MFS transporter
MFPKRAVAKLTGVGSTAGSLGGMAFPLITGILLDRFANGYAIIFGFCSVAYIIAFIANHLLAPSYNPVRLDSRSP